MVDLSDESGSEDEEEKKRLKMAKGLFTRAFLTVGYVAQMMRFYSRGAIL